VSSPVGKADVVIVVEQSSHNQAVFKDLVTPLIATLSTDLKGRGLTDVEFALIGFGAPGQQWPQHFGNNGKVTYEGKSDNIQFGDTEKLQPPYDTPLQKFKFVKKFIEVELGKEQIVIAMNEANKYPFRTGASKIIILVNSSPCTPSITFPFSLQLPRIISIYRYYREHALNFYLVSAVNDIAVEGGKSKNVVGFDSEKVYYLGDKKGVAEDRSKLTYKDDLCLSFSQYYGGAAFSSQNFINTSEKKKFVEVVSQRIAVGAVKHKYTEECGCTLKAGLFPVTECRVASSELKAR